MRHARSDYNRIQDPHGLIPADEPVFLLRGQDRHLPAVIKYYIDLVKADNGDPDVIKSLEIHLARVNAWPKKKSPDLAR
jgi:hypothetical protein